MVETKSFCFFVLCQAWYRRIWVRAFWKPSQERGRCATDCVCQLQNQETLHPPSTSFFVTDVANWPDTNDPILRCLSKKSPKKSLFLKHCFLCVVFLAANRQDLLSKSKARWRCGDLCASLFASSVNSSVEKWTAGHQPIDLSQLLAV